MKIAERKLLETKRKIITLIRNREHTAALNLFYKTFNDKNPAEAEFIESFYLELNRLNMFEIGFRMLAETSIWHADNQAVIDLRNNSAKLYYDSLILLGNNLLFEREEKASHFHDTLRRSDSMSREKMREENEKILKNIIMKALGAFQKAYELNDSSIPALSGLSRCYGFLKDKEKFNEIEKLLIEKSPTIKLQEKVGELLQADSSEPDTNENFTPKEYDIEEFNLIEIRNLLEQKKYRDLINRVDFLHLSHKLSVPMLLLKAKAQAELKEFKAYDKTIFEAERANSHFKEIQLLKNDINEIKYRLLTKAAETYLRKGLEIGPSLGRAHFEKTVKSINQALEIIPENVDLLDQLYTALMYLGKDKEAFKVKASIYILNQTFITSFDRESSSSLCFIASFAFKENPLKIEEFRWFRREVLLPFSAGRAFNSFYVRHSPSVTHLAEHIHGSRAFFRFLLQPLLYIIRLLKFII